jgi:hypothetical protein
MSETVYLRGGPLDGMTIPKANFCGNESLMLGGMRLGRYRSLRPMASGQRQAEWSGLGDASTSCPECGGKPCYMGHTGTKPPDDEGHIESEFADYRASVVDAGAES